MNDQKAFARTLRSLENQEQDLLRELRKVRAAISAIRDLMPKQTTAEAAVGKAIAGVRTSLAEEIYRVLELQGRPLHVTEIVSRLQENGIGADQNPKGLRQTVAGTISRKKRDGDKTFVSVSPGVVGLREFETTKVEPGGGAAGVDESNESEMENDTA